MAELKVGPAAASAELAGDGSGAVLLGSLPVLALAPADVVAVRSGLTPAAPVPVPVPIPIPTPKATIIGVDVGGWGGVFAQMAAEDFKWFRSYTTAHLAEAATHGVFPSTIVFGTGGTLASINPATYAAHVHEEQARFGLKKVELFNEPGGVWFYPDANTAAANKNVMACWKATHEALKGTGCKVQASYDGGVGGSVAFGRAMAALGAYAYADEVTMHPYGGSGVGHGRNTSAEGWIEGVELAHKETGLPVTVSEVGFPTGPAATGDSKAWSEKEQAAHVKAFGEFCIATPYVPEVDFYNLVNQDDTSNAQYGMWKHTLAPKLATAALTDLSQKAAVTA